MAFSRLEGPSGPMDTPPPPQVTLLSCILLLAPYGNVKNVLFLNLCHMTPLFGPQCSVLYSLHCTVQCTVECTVYSVLHSLHCTVQCTVDVFFEDFKEGI